MKESTKKIIFGIIKAALVLSVCGIIMVICGVCNLTAYGRSSKYLYDSNIIDAE